MYNIGSRQLQRRFNSTALADRLVEVEARGALTPDDIAFVRRSFMFFLATADPGGHPLCSYKGGDPGFVKVFDEHHLAWPDYDGNGTFRSLGNVEINSHVALLFIDFQRGDRLQIEGRATIRKDAANLKPWTGAQLAIHVEVTRAFSACSRYIHRMVFEERSPFVPREGHTPPVPAWKTKPSYSDVLPECSPVDREEGDDE